MNLRTTNFTRFLCVLLLNSAIIQAADLTTIKGESVKALTEDEATKCVGGYIWRLDITVPTGAKRMQVTLGLATKEKDEAAFAAGVTSPLATDTPLRLLVVLVPLGRDIRECEEVRVTVIGFGNHWSSTVEKNPFRGSRGVGKSAEPEKVSAGKYNLMGSFSGDKLPLPLSGADKVLRLNIDTD